MGVYQGEATIRFEVMPFDLVPPDQAELTDLDPEIFHDLDDPFEQVELQLRRYSQNFVASQVAWQTVKDARDELVEAARALSDQEVHSRADRRDKQRRRTIETNGGSHVALAWELAQRKFATQVRPAFDTAETPAEGLRASVEVLNDQEMTSIPDRLEMLRPVFEKNFVLSQRLMYAFLVDHAGISGIKEFLKDDAVVNPFVERLSQLAEVKPGGLMEFPGLLELVATQVMKEGKDNFLKKAMARVTPERDELALDFIDSAMERSDIVAQGMWKSIAAAIQVLRLTCQMDVDEGLIDRDGYIARFAARHGDWPEPLMQALGQYEATLNSQQWQAINAALEPHAKTGRRLVKGAASVTNLGRMAAKAKAPKVEGLSGKVSVPTLTRRGQRELDDMGGVEVGEREPIANIAVLKTDNASQRRYAPEAVNSLDELMEDSVVTRVTRNHQQLTGSIREGIEFLLSNPFDKTSTRRLRHGEFLLDSDPKKRSWRHMRRMSFQDIPTIDRTSPEASRIRILYDVVNIDGQQTFVLHGVYMKHEVVNLQDLPRR